MQISFLRLWHTSDDQSWYKILFLIKENINNNVDKDDHNNIDDEKGEPKINVFKVSSLRKWGIDRGQESSKDCWSQLCLNRGLSLSLSLYVSIP